jgi:ABC-2 type transport system permease protein
MLRLLLHQSRYDLKTVRANRQARFTTLLLPIVLLVVVIAVTGKEPVRVEGAALTPATYFTPGLIAFAVLAGSLMSLTVELVVQRESGVLKRRRARPIPAWTLVAARIAVAIVTSLAVSALLVIVATNGYDAAIPFSAIPAILIMIIAGAAAMSALAYALATAIRSSTAAQPVVALVTLPLYLISGMFFPASKLPPALDAAANLLPLEHLAHGLRHALLPAATGARLDAADVAVLIAWTLAGGIVAVRRFRWLPYGAASSARSKKPTMRRS